MYTFKLKYYSGDIQGKGGTGATFIEHSIKPLYDGSLDREMQGARKRIKFTGRITLVNNANIGVNDYTLFKQIEALNAGKTIFIDIVGDGVNFTGYFYPFNCTVNDDNCTVELPELMPYDEYTIFDEIGDKMFNLVDELDPYQEININEPVRMEYYTSEREYESFLTSPDISCERPYQPPLSYSYLPWDSTNLFYKTFPTDWWQDNYYDWHPAAAPGLIMSVWQLRHMTDVFPYGVPYTAQREALTAMCRVVENEIFVLEYLGLFPVLLQNQIELKKKYKIKVKTKWALEVNDIVSGTTPPNVADGWVLLQTGILLHNVPHDRYGRIPFYDNQTYHYNMPEYVCGQYFKYKLLNPYTGGAYNSHLTAYNRRLIDVFGMFITKTGLSYVSSHFFLDIINPITGLPNTGYFLSTVKDLCNPTAGSISPLMEISWNNIINSLQALFPIDWKINGDTLIIEHQKYFENGGSYTQDINLVTDVRGLQNIQTLRSQIVRTNKYTYDDGNIFNIESFHNAGFFNIEFKPVSILYGIFTKDRRENIRTTQFITDIGGVFSNTTQFPDDGICLIAAKNINGVWECESEIDYLTNLTIANGHLSSANIITTYWKDYRMFIRASFESTNIIFNSESNKKVQNILISDCNCVSLCTDNLIKTNLGVGKIISSRHNLLTKTTELTLLIGYAEN